MGLFKRKKSAPKDLRDYGPRRVIVQRGASQADGYVLERKNRLETIYFRSEEDRDFAARADQLAYDLRKEAAS